MHRLKNVSSTAQFLLTTLFRAVLLENFLQTSLILHVFKTVMQLFAMKKQAKIIQQLTVNSLELANFPKLKTPMLFQTEHLAMQVRERELLFLPI